MRTNIDIDIELLKAAKNASGLSTTKATVAEALRHLVLGQRQRRAIRDMWGLGWGGDLDEMRRDGFRSVDE